MTVQTLYDIRDARELCAEEKSILWAVATRGESWGAWATVAGDAGLSKERFYKYRTGLVSRDLLSVTERPGSTSLYRVNGEAVASLTPHGDPPGKPDNPQTEEDGDPSGKPDRGFPGNPTTTLPENPTWKRTSKETPEGDQSSEPAPEEEHVCSVWCEALTNKTGEPCSLAGTSGIAPTR